MHIFIGRWVGSRGDCSKTTREAQPPLKIMEKIVYYYYVVLYLLYCIYIGISSPALYNVFKTKSFSNQFPQFVCFLFFFDNVIQSSLTGLQWHLQYALFQCENLDVYWTNAEKSSLPGRLSLTGSEWRGRAKLLPRGGWGSVWWLEELLNREDFYSLTAS